MDSLEGSREESKQRTPNALDELFAQVGIYRNGSDLRHLFEFIKKFPKIAPFNAMLLHIQKPGSQWVAHAVEWRKIFKRTIRPGARPLVILKPFGPVEFVFELTDTEGEPFPDDLLHPFRAEGEVSPKHFENLKKNLKHIEVRHNEADQGTGSGGSIEASLRKQPIGRPGYGRLGYDIVVNKNHPPTDRYATIVHELGHLFCGHVGTTEDEWCWWPSRQHLDKHHGIRGGKRCLACLRAAGHKKSLREISCRIP